MGGIVLWRTSGTSACRRVGGDERHKIIVVIFAKGTAGLNDLFPIGGSVIRRDLGRGGLFAKCRRRESGQVKEIILGRFIDWGSILKRLLLLSGLAVAIQHARNTQSGEINGGSRRLVRGIIYGINIVEPVRAFGFWLWVNGWGRDIPPIKAIVGRGAPARRALIGSRCEVKIIIFRDLRERCACRRLMAIPDGVGVKDMRD